MTPFFFFPTIVYSVNGEPGNKLKSKRNTPHKGKFGTLIHIPSVDFIYSRVISLFPGHWKVKRPNRRWASCSPSTATHPAKVSSKLVSSLIDYIKPTILVRQYQYWSRIIWFGPSWIPYFSYRLPWSQVRRRISNWHYWSLISSGQAIIGNLPEIKLFLALPLNWIWNFWYFE